MYRGLLSLLVVLLGAGVVAADLRPPEGRNIPMEHTIITEKEYPDYNFYLVNEKLIAVKLDPKVPIEIKTGDSFGSRLVGVPKDIDKRFVNEEERLSSLRKEVSIEGIVRSKTRFNSDGTVPETDQRTKIVLEHRIEGIDAKNGTIVLATKHMEPMKGGEKKDSPDDAPGVGVYTPRNGVWVAGTAASLALVLGGLWFAWRARRKA
jgi:hypothetical protein